MTPAFAGDPDGASLPIWPARDRPLRQPAGAQTLDFLSNEAPIGPVVTGAPYSGEGVTILKLKLFDGTRIERKVTARFYRDSAGRIRREQTIIGLAALNPSDESPMVVTIVDHVAGFIYALNPGSRTAHKSRSTRGPPPRGCSAASRLRLLRRHGRPVA